MPTQLESLQLPRTVAGQPASLLVALHEVEQKRDIDIVRFRTCCADPRASK
jgi:hypothetical protein